MPAEEVGTDTVGAVEDDDHKADASRPESATEEEAIMCWAKEMVDDSRAIRCFECTALNVDGTAHCDMCGNALIQSSIGAEDVQSEAAKELQIAKLNLVPSTQSSP